MKSWVIVLSVILCVLHHSHVKAQPDSIRHDRLLNQRSVREKLRVTITPSVGIGLVSGDLEGQDGLVRYVKPGVAVSGMVKVLLQPSDPQKRFGLGLLFGITASVGNRRVYEERVWFFWNFERRALDANYLQQTAYYFGPIIQIGRRGGALRCQFSIAWNRSNWVTNQFDSEDWYTDSGDYFKDDRTGGGAFLFLLYKRYSVALMHHELKARVIFPHDTRPDYSAGITAKTTWVTIGVSF